MLAGNSIRMFLVFAVFVVTCMLSQNALSQRQPIQYDALKRAPMDVGRDVRGGCPSGSFQVGDKCFKCSREDRFDENINYCVRCSNYDTYIGRGRCQKN